MTLRLNGSTSGYVEIDAPAVAGSNTLVLPTGNGSANQILKNGGTAGSLAFGTATEDGSGNFAFNSGFDSVATAYGCRAWVNFNGTGTVAIRDSGNVSSITDNAAGAYTVNFTNSMPDANYSLTGSAQYNGTDNCWVEWSDNRTSTTDKVEVHIAKAGALIDSPRVSIAIHR